MHRISITIGHYVSVSKVVSALIAAVYSANLQNKIGVFYDTQLSQCVCLI